MIKETYRPVSPLVIGSKATVIPILLSVLDQALTTLTANAKGLSIAGIVLVVEVLFIFILKVIVKAETSRAIKNLQKDIKALKELVSEASTDVSRRKAQAFLAKKEMDLSQIISDR